MTSATWLVWVPRVLGIGVSAFLALFALDAFEAGRPFVENVAAFTMHLLPSLILLAIVAVAWRWEWIGGLGFIGLAVLYAVSVGGRLDWVLAISGPLLIVGLLFLWSWRHRERSGVAV